MKLFWMSIRFCAEPKDDAASIADSIITSMSRRAERAASLVTTERLARSSSEPPLVPPLTCASTDTALAVLLVKVMMLSATLRSKSSGAIAVARSRRRSATLFASSPAMVRYSIVEPSIERRYNVPSSMVPVCRVRVCVPGVLSAGMAARRFSTSASAVLPRAPVSVVATAIPPATPSPIAVVVGPEASKTVSVTVTVIGVCELLLTVRTSPARETVTPSGRTPAAVRPAWSASAISVVVAAPSAATSPSVAVSEMLTTIGAAVPISML